MSPDGLGAGAPGEAHQPYGGGLFLPRFPFWKILSSFFVIFLCPSYHFDIQNRSLIGAQVKERCPRCSTFGHLITHSLFSVVFSPFFAIFLISTLILPYFFKNRDHFAGGTPNQGLWNDSTDDYCITLSLFDHFYSSTFYGQDQKYLSRKREPCLAGHQIKSNNDRQSVCDKTMNSFRTISRLFIILCVDNNHCL